MGTFCAPNCKIPISTIFHSVLLVDDITAILSLGFTPNLSKPLLMVFAKSIYSLVDVDFHSPLYLVVNDFSRL
jgi:hypothetical protein